MKDPSFVVTLVHGTFGKRSAWVKEDSVFCTTIKNALNGRVSFSTFSCSGHNAQGDRRLAGSELAKSLQKQLEQYPTSEHFVVGHSHGGNIALYALADEVL